MCSVPNMSRNRSTFDAREPKKRMAADITRFPTYIRHILEWPDKRHLCSQLLHKQVTSTALPDTAIFTTHTSCQPRHARNSSLKQDLTTVNLRSSLHFIFHFRTGKYKSDLHYTLQVTEQIHMICIRNNNNKNLLINVFISFYRMLPWMRFSGP